MWNFAKQNHNFIIFCVVDARRNCDFIYAKFHTFIIYFFFKKMLNENVISLYTLYHGVILLFSISFGEKNVYWNYTSIVMSCFNSPLPYTTQSWFCWVFFSLWKTLWHRIFAAQRRCEFSIEQNHDSIAYYTIKSQFHYAENLYPFCATEIQCYNAFGRGIILKFGGF